MAILTTDYVDNAIGEETRLAFAPTTEAFDQYEAQARAVVQSVAQVAGYTVTDDSDNAMVRLATLGQWYFFAGGLRNGLEVPSAISAAINLLEQIRQGNLPIPGLTPSTQDGIGGVKFSATTGSNAREQVFSREKMSEW